MPKVKQHKARTDVYVKGIRIPDEKTKSGFRVDKSQPNPEGDEIFCKKGDTYFSWGMMVGGRGIQRKSLTYPKRSQLTNSEFLSAVYDLEDGINWGGAESPEDLQQMRDDLAQEVRDLGEQQQEKFDNMPDGLQQGDTGQLLEQRAQACEQYADDLENVDLDYDEPDDQEIEDEIEDAELDAIEVADRVEKIKEEKLEEWLQEKRDELEGLSWEYE